MITSRPAAFRDRHDIDLRHLARDSPHAGRPAPCPSCRDQPTSRHPPGDHGGHDERPGPEVRILVGHARCEVWATSKRDARVTTPEPGAASSTRR
jgi:hypothetical protein